MLTIVIPTFARNEVLERTLPLLLPQISSDCRLLILDNCSPVPVADSLHSLLVQWPAVQCRIVRHRCNLGATANILRCFELCETEWLWALGDDDIVVDDAISVIFDFISKYEDAAYFSFKTRDGGGSKNLKEPVVSNGLTEFIEKLASVHDVNFMSCSVWRTNAFISVLRFGYHYSYSMGWSLALLLHALGKKEQAVFTNRELIAQASIVPVELRWSYREFIVGWPLLLEAPIEDDARKSFYRKMLSLHSPENIAAYLLAVSGVGGSSREKLMYYRLAASRVIPYNVHFLARFRFLLYRPLFWFPRSSWKLIKGVIHFANRIGLKHVNIAEMEGRAQ